MAVLTFLKGAVRRYNTTSLILRILIGIIIGAILAFVAPGWTWLETLGSLFVGALKAIAPVLVFVLVAGALAQGSSKLDRRFGSVIFFYMLTTFLAGVIAVVMSFLFPQTLVLKDAATADTIPQGIGEVLYNLLMKVVENPFSALMNANYIGILAWAALFGAAMKALSSDTTKQFMSDVADGISQIVRWVINLAPFGIMGLVFGAVHENGMAIFKTYGKLVLLLVCCMLGVALIVNGLICGIALRRNPYPLIFKCMKESGLTAFFTRSSAANIPINMDGAAITISVMTLACAHTMGISVDLPTAIILSVLSAFAACGASGVAGGSLLLIPMACSLFGISNDIAMQVVAVGFIIGVVQDSLETMLNSSGDVVFAATAEFRQWQKEGKRLPGFMYSARERASMGIDRDFPGDITRTGDEPAQ